MADRLDLAQGQATVFYPAVTSEELQSEALLLANYRKSLGQIRLLVGGVVVLSAAWAFDHLRRKS